ncbi:MAG TPA: type II secretion system protein GspG [Longimicrobiales bacterium]|nr:type II secretion system protein GspG [Longimicrobiales bacterium]
MVKRLFLLVLAAFAVGMAVPSTRAEIQARTFTPVMDEIGRRLAPGRLEAMANQLDVRLGRAEGLPDRFDGWIRRDYSGPETDPWGNPWFLVAARRTYTVGSMGPDGERGTDDDITETRDLPSFR